MSKQKALRIALVTIGGLAGKMRIVGMFLIIVGVFVGIAGVIGLAALR